MANCQGQAEAVAEEDLQVAFPCSGTAPIAAPAIRQDQQPVGPRISSSALLLPPLCDGDDRKFRGVVRDPDIDMAPVPDQFVDAEGDRPAFGRTREVVLIDLLGLFCFRRNRSFPDLGLA